MASESTPPPPPQGGGARYAIAGVALAAVALLGYCLLQPPAPTPATTTPTPGPVDAGPTRSTALADDEIVIPDEEPDAGLPDAWSAPAEEPRHTTTTHVAAGSWDCTGEIDRAAIQSVMTQYRPQIQACYERGLKSNPMLQGSMTLQMKVGAAGRVEATQVSGSLRDRDVFSCVRQISTRIQFPRVSGGSCMVVAVPFSFTPQQ